MSELSVLRAEEIQTQQLLEWKELLKEEVYVALTIYIRKDNHLARRGEDILRGVSMSNFIQNFLMYKRTGRLEKELGLRGYEEYQRYIMRGSLPCSNGMCVNVPRGTK